MKITSYTPGTPAWIDLGVPDIDAAATFYSALFGWETQDMGPDAGGYRMCTLNGDDVAGLGPASRDDVPPYWTMYISVTDVDETAAKVTAAGGETLMGPVDVMEAGRMAAFADVTGAAFSIWQPKENIGSQLVNEPGTLCWTELMSRDCARSKAFYADVFGWEATDMPMGETTYTMFNLPAKPGDDKSVAGLFEMGSDIPAEMPPTWCIYFSVADTDDTVARAVGLGASIVVEPTDIMPGRFAMLKDPQGALFSVLQFAAAS